MGNINSKIKGTNKKSNLRGRVDTGNEVIVMDSSANPFAYLAMIAKPQGFVPSYAVSGSNGRKKGVHNYET